VRLLLTITALTLFAVTPCAGANEKSFDSNGVKIAYLDEGKGEVVVLLHGFTLSATDMWVNSPFTKTQFLPSLVKNYRVIAPDLRGHGQSDKPHDSKKYGTEMAEDVFRLLDHLKVEKAHVVGYSMGAWVAGNLLVAHPDRLLSATFGGSGPLHLPSKTFTEMFAATAESLEKDKGLGPLLTVEAEQTGSPKPTPEQLAVINKLALAGKDQKALAAVLRGMKAMEVTADQLKAATVPAQFVYGRLEGQANVNLMIGAQKALPKAEAIVIDKHDHFSTVGSPEFQSAVRKFIETNRR
jgi:pimeloyl-ACP methyl ester carboxylesterase